MSAAVYHSSATLAHVDHQSQRRAHKRGPWSQQEDHYLMGLVAQIQPHNWVKISEILGSRSAKQCRERYHQNLKPSLNHEPISEAEGKMIESMVASMGKRWADIARKLRNRSDNQVKNWWNGSMNRRKRLEAKRAQQQTERPLPTLEQQRTLPPLPGHHYRQSAVQPQEHHRLPSLTTTPRYIHAQYGMDSPLPSPSSMAPSPATESLSLPQSPSYTLSSPMSNTTDSGYSATMRLPPPMPLHSHPVHSLPARAVPTPTASSSGNLLPPLSSFSQMRD